MNRQRGTTPVLHIMLRVILIGMAITLCVLSLALPQTHLLRSALYLFLGLIFLGGGLLVDSWFADVFGTHNTPLLRQYGPRGARLVFSALGLAFIAVAAASLFW
jgi:hypothetical protein